MTILCVLGITFYEAVLMCYLLGIRVQLDILKCCNYMDAVDDRMLIWV